jgi:outer membrane protein assembly factor BamD (BamD/ComL family)
MVLLSGCQEAKKYYQRIEAKAERINRFEQVALELSKENRQLKAQVSNLEFQIQKMKSRNEFLEMKKGEKALAHNEADDHERHPASVTPGKVDETTAHVEDMVKFAIYKWKADELFAVADKEFNKENYKKSIQFYQAILENYPHFEKINDDLLYRTGVSAFKTTGQPNVVIENMKTLVARYPASKHFREAKLWMALAYLEVGKDEEFWKTAEEFRLKYKNTPEWNILRPHYEEIMLRYKR